MTASQNAQRFDYGCHFASVSPKTEVVGGRLLVADLQSTAGEVRSMITGYYWTGSVSQTRNPLCGWLSHLFACVPAGARLESRRAAVPPQPRQFVVAI